jgi:hypothetical protein
MALKPWSSGPIPKSHHKIICQIQSQMLLKLRADCSFTLTSSTSKAT